MNLTTTRLTKFIDLGVIDFAKAWDYQTDLFNKILEVKKANRQDESSANLTENYLLFCEHPHVFTLGKSGDEKNLLIAKENLNTINATYHHINRGGDITYHGPGQIVVYPVIDMENFFTDIHKYMRLLEDAVIQTLAHYGIESGRIAGLTGVWLEPETERARKICALGVKTSRWVTMHGLAFNVNADLSYFKYIVPCGIADKAVTSMAAELGGEQNLSEVKSVLKEKIASIFEMEIVN
ncbi:MAG: lipoyl(octanoyl) transferase LipB [Cyclobacteriaceae bacterium]